MKILRDAGSFEILTPEATLRQQLLIIEQAGRTCYQSFRGEVTQKSAEKFVRMILSRNPPHESVIEHGWMTVRFAECSRGFTHELVRHRLASFSQESTRYVDYARRGGKVDLKRFQVQFVMPPHRRDEPVPRDDGRGMMTPTQMVEEMERSYRALRAVGWSPQDARQFLPIGQKAEIVMSANFREWRHIFRMRTAKDAHWEIRRVMGNLLAAVQQLVPVVFDDFVEAGADENGLRFFEQRPFSP